jgi:hypothetical protein
VYVLLLHHLESHGEGEREEKDGRREGEGEGYNSGSNGVDLRAVSRETLMKAVALAVSLVSPLILDAPPAV